MNRLTVCLLLVFGGILFGCGDGPTEEMPLLAFDSEQWKACEDPDQDTRFQMVPSLIKEHRLVGQSMAEVQALLGETPWKEEENGVLRHHYRLGHERTKWGVQGWPFMTVKYRDRKVVRVSYLAGMGAVAPSVLLQD